MPHDDSSQPAYVTDLTWMLGFMTQNQAFFQEQLANAMTMLANLQ